MLFHEPKWLQVSSRIFGFAVCHSVNRGILDTSELLLIPFLFPRILPNDSLGWGVPLLLAELLPTTARPGFPLVSAKQLEWYILPPTLTAFFQTQSSFSSSHSLWNFSLHIGQGWSAKAPVGAWIVASGCGVDSLIWDVCMVGIMEVSSSRLLIHSYAR